MIGGGMVFPRKLKDVHDFTRAVLGREAVELLDGCKASDYERFFSRYSLGDMPFCR